MTDLEVFDQTEAAEPGTVGMLTELLLELGQDAAEIPDEQRRARLGKLLPRTRGVIIEGCTQAEHHLSELMVLFELRAYTAAIAAVVPKEDTRFARAMRAAYARESELTLDRARDLAAHVAWHELVDLARG